MPDKKAIDTHRGSCYKHMIDIESMYCTKCGKPRSALISANTIKEQCNPPANVKAISHLIAKRNSPFHL